MQNTAGGRVIRGPEGQEPNLARRRQHTLSFQGAAGRVAGGAGVKALLLKGGHLTGRPQRPLKGPTQPQGPGTRVSKPLRGEGDTRQSMCVPSIPRGVSAKPSTGRACACTPSPEGHSGGPQPTQQVWQPHPHVHQLTAEKEDT